ncbi:ABC-2 type transport system ATP-binding protein [Kineosphaera limosa]|uniref:Putative ABC transporter ATP-binding protein n=1 Tax=Kineosphaera limosa NBRC 100340 TaxID=1184609 RepID=K6VIE9_9MICO|nr:ABC transporter ATP-binding protein [Kineosphaera limosa]NYE02467.1 ABC-2 type transport system ATP-binding protein [Kineosphaera limosa]GAB96008.1 putative ABC transporter ATP-binding protein [Kineosphaera limosa NBRC 100340]
MSTTEDQTSGGAAIDIRGLRKHYGPVHALDGVELQLTPGRIVGLLGENGCGKTTLLKVLAGVVSDYTGQVRIAGHTPGPASKARVSFLPDTSFLPDRARVRDCVNIYRDFFTDFDAELAADRLAHFGFDEGLRLKEASKGMREKIQIALAMSRRAAVYLLDEPISGVDPAAREVLLEAIVRDLHPEALVFISTHLVHDLEPVLDSVVFMRHGRITLSGDVDDLRAEHGASLDQIFREVHR